MKGLGDELMLVLGTTAGISVLLSEDKFGRIPEGELGALTSNAIDALLKAENLRTEEEERFFILAIAISVIVDQSGVSDRIKARFKLGNRSFTESEMSAIASMAVTHAQQFAKKRGDNSFAGVKHIYK